MESELENIRYVYGDRAKVMTSQGYPWPCLIVRPVPKFSKFVVEFQMNETYPYDLPTMSLLGLTNSEATLLWDKLQILAQQLRGKPMFLELLSECQEWIENKETTVASSIPKHVSEHQSKSVEEILPIQTVPHEKMKRMRTAEEVISRVRWDEKFEASDFVVVYLDRFLGEMETKFDQVDWDDPPFPQHRIQCFKHNGETVWDKRIPLDRVFGSRGDTSNI